MSIFGSNNKKSQASVAPVVAKPKINSSTLIASSMTITGDLKGTDSIHIDGTVIGDVSVKNTLIIGQTGKIEGNIEADTIIINGELKGTVKCKTLDVMQTGKVSKHIEARNIRLDGNITGEIIGEARIDVLENSKINTTHMHCKTIAVHGSISGKVIATEILEIGEKGFVEGEITVKNIRTEEGGRMIGTMSTYQAPTTSSPAPKATRATKAPAKKETQEDDFFEAKS